MGGSFGGVSIYGVGLLPIVKLARTGGIKNYTFIGDGYMPLPISWHNISIEISITYNMYQFWNGHSWPETPYRYMINF
jgi:hypothetical protein